MAESAAARGREYFKAGREAGEGFHQIAAAETEAAPGSAKSILIVDDNVDAAETLAMLLGFSNHQVSIAHRPEEALRTLDSTRPDIILLDIGLPGMDGLELAKIIRARPETTGVLLVAVTGYGREEDRRQALDAGFDIHLTKPVAYGDLEKLLKILPRT